MTEEQQPRRRGNPTLVVGIIVVVVIVVGGILAYVAWQAIEARPTPIGDILADMRTYDGQPVTVRGEVASVLNILGLKAFDLDDGSGTIKVVTQRGLPQQGETVTVSGVVNEMFNVGGMNMTVILEGDGTPGG